MWEVNEGRMFRFRCHTGHGFTSETLLSQQNEKVEAALWSAVRTLRERAALYRQIAERITQPGLENVAQRYLSKAVEEDARSFVIEEIIGRTVHSPLEPLLPRSSNPQTPDVPPQSEATKS
jgi:two-component system chemotaxis response regulator CheB